VLMMDLTTHNHPTSMLANARHGLARLRRAAMLFLGCTTRGQVINKRAARSRHPSIIATGRESLDQLGLFSCQGRSSWNGGRQDRSGDAPATLVRPRLGPSAATELGSMTTCCAIGTLAAKLSCPASMWVKTLRVYEAVPAARPRCNIGRLRHTMVLTQHFRQRHPAQWQLPLEVCAGPQIFRRLLLQFSATGFWGDGF